MAKKRSNEKDACCSPEEGQKHRSCCSIDAILTVDSRGQVVLPKDIRSKMNINSGDKLLVISHESDDRICCLTLMKADDFSGSVKNMLGPVMKDIVE